MASILVCDDQRSICEMLDISLRRDGHRVETVNAGEAAKKKLSAANYEVLITDIKMPQTDGIEVLRFARQVCPETSVILITAVEDYEAAVQAVKGGAFDYIHKGPGLLEELKISVGRAVESLLLRRQNFAYKRDAATRNSLENMVGNSPAINKLKETIRTIASTSSTVLIYGESGDRKSTRLNSSHVRISYAVFCLKKKIKIYIPISRQQTVSTPSVYVVALEPLSHHFLPEHYRASFVPLTTLAIFYCRDQSS